MEFPVGYHRFLKNKFLNYQLNRWYALGYARKEDLDKIASQIHTFEDFIQAFQSASEEAKQEGRLKNAAAYLRGSEFLIPPDDERKIPVYQAFIKLFDEAFADEPFERHNIPFNGSFLTAFKIPAKTTTTKGTIIGIPGFDAFIEEFYSIWDYFAQRGYDVIAFEGPGQGGSRRLYNQVFDHDYEKATGAVLDYFKCKEVTALGVSMGGYWIMRAAAFEKRIKRVIAMAPVYDWLEMTNAVNQFLARWFLSRPKLTNFFVRQKMQVKTLKHTVNNALFIQDKKEPFEAVQWMMGMNKEHISSHLIDQDVFLMTGENDAFQPPVLLRKQAKALTHAKSVSTRIFTKEEHADQHCQMGNLGLALGEIVDWLEVIDSL